VGASRRASPAVPGRVGGLAGRPVANLMDAGGHGWARAAIVGLLAGARRPRVRRKPVSRGQAVSKTPKPGPSDVEGAGGPPAEPAAELVAAGAPDAAPTPLFSSRLEAGVHVIRFSRADVLDAHYIERLGDQIYHHIKSVDAPRVVIDLGNVQQLSSTALGMLIALRKVIVDRQGGKIALSNVREELRKVFRITKLNKLLKIHDSTQQAIADLG
jgi:anti-anti-sigma factor